MKFTYAKFKNYIGFFNGMGLSEVSIDFTKCKNNIILIAGANGVGKSTLMNALTIFPDSSSSFVPGKDAEKLLGLTHIGDLYDIQIISTADSSGGRKTTKAFIQKNGVEMNPNGNVTSYKDIIFSEFELDSNFISLTKISIDDKGLGNKTPAERKKFAASIVENLDTYNDMYKTLNKQSIAYRSHINNLHTKIQNIGSKDNIESTLKALQEQERTISSKIMDLNNLIVTIKAKSTIDPAEAEELNKLNDRLRDLNLGITLTQDRIAVLRNSTKIKEEDIAAKYEETVNNISEYNTLAENYHKSWLDISDRIKSNSDSINSANAAIESFSTSSISSNVAEEYDASKKRYDNIISELNSLNIPSDTELIVTISSILEYFETFCESIDSLYSDCTIDDMDYIVYHYDDNLYNDLGKQIAELEVKNVKTQETISQIREDMKKIAILENRPSKCKIDDCPFVADSIKLKKALGNKKLEDELSALQDVLMDISISTTDIDEKMRQENFRRSKHTILRAITDGILKNMPKFSKLNIPEFRNLETVMTSIASMNPFNNIRDPQRLRDGLNYLKMLSEESIVLDKLAIEFEAYKAKEANIKINKDLLSKLEAERDQLLKDSIDAKNNYESYYNLKTKLQNNVSSYKDYKDQYEKLTKELLPRKEIYEEQIESINKKSANALSEVSKINEYNDAITTLTNEAVPITTEISRLNGQLTLLDSYIGEYNEYKQNYETIEILKKYCSPTNGGIQVLFMQLYMSKTLEIANQILAMLFGGEYRLLDFVINDSEFRIPFIGSGLAVDDISSGSASQVCMMSMIINLVLLHQASTKFNIARLDEIESPLDSINRSNFINILYRMIPLLNIDQLFIISHNLLEADTSAVDIVKLKSYDNFDIQLAGNIIYDYDAL